MPWFVHRGRIAPMKRATRSSCYCSADRRSAQKRRGQEKAKGEAAVGARQVHQGSVACRRLRTARFRKTDRLWSPAARFSDLASDLRARRVDDIVTILVQESASAVSTGTIKTARQSSAQANIAALPESLAPTGPLANLANLGSTNIARRARHHQPSDHLDHDPFRAGDARAAQRQPGDRRHQEPQRSIPRTR